MSDALLNMYLCPDGSLNVIFACGFPIIVLLMYSNAPCSAIEYDTSLNCSSMDTPVRSTSHFSLWTKSPLLFLTSIRNSILTPLSTPSSMYPDTTFADSPVVICDRSTHPLHPSPCCPLDCMFLNFDPANILQYTSIT